jgi:phosphate transport system protein
VEVSHQALEMNDRVDDSKDMMVLKMKEPIKTSPDQAEIGLGIIMIAKNLERMAGHATKTAEEGIYLTTGNDVRHGHLVTANSEPTCRPRQSKTYFSD